MKKISVYFGIIAAAALTLVSCAKEIDNPNIVEEPTIEEGIPFEIVANPATKTATSGMTTTWVADDKINLFHAVAGSTTYVDDKDFTISSENLASGTFTGSLTSAPASGSYDWYAMYPYSDKLTTPANTSYYSTFGSYYTSNQTQSGYDSTEHLDGNYYPLYGKAAGVAFDAKPSITLSHLASFIEVTVTNKNSEPLTVTNVTFTAPTSKKIIGNFYVKFSDGTITERSGYVSNVASLNVSGGTALAKDESAKFYIGVKPFNTTAGDEIKISVNGYEKTISTTKNFTFASGKMKSVNFDYDYSTDIVEPTAKTGWYLVQKASWLAAGDRVIIANVDAKVALSITQNSNNRAAESITTGADGVYTTLTTNANVQEFILETGTAAGSFAFWNDNGNNPNKYIYAASSSANHLKTQDALDGNASFSVAIDTDGNATLTANGSYTRNLLRYNDANTIFSCYSTGQNPVAVFKYYGGSTPTCTTPVITLDGSTVTITSTVGASIYYTTNGDTPTTSSTAYSAPFDIATSCTIKAIAVRDHYNDSAIGSEDCIPTVKCATPVITSNGTSFGISCATDGVTIYYETSTTNLGSVATPTTSSSVYSSAVSITQTTYVKAYAVKAGCTDSDVASETCVYSSGGGATKTYTLTINASDFNTTSYAANNNEKTSTATATDSSTMSVKWTSNQVMKNGDNMQWQKNKGYIYNSTDLGTIISVTVNSSAGTFTTYYGTDEQPDSGAADSGKGYFKTSVGNATGTTSSVVIVFEI